MTGRLRNLFPRLFRAERGPRRIEQMSRLRRGELSTFQKTLAMHIATTTQRAGRTWVRQ